MTTATINIADANTDTIANLLANGRTVQLGDVTADLCRYEGLRVMSGADYITEAAFSARWAAEYIMREAGIDLGTDHVSRAEALADRA